MSSRCSATRDSSLFRVRCVASVLKQRSIINTLLPVVGEAVFLTIHFHFSLNIVDVTVNVSVVLTFENNLEAL